MTEQQLRSRLDEVANEITRWQTVANYSTLSSELQRLEQLRNSRKGNLLDAAESSVVVATVIKDPTLFTDIEYLANGSYGTVYVLSLCTKLFS